MNEKKNKKNFFQQLKELYASPKGKAIIFFSFYFFFFLILSLVGHFGSRGTVGENRYDKKQQYQFSFDLLDKENYHFFYQISKDAELLSYEGDKNKEKELFTSSILGVNETYYRESNTYLKNTNPLWIKVESPYQFSSFFELSTVREMLEKASYISKTDYESGKQVYRFAISTSTMISLFEGIETDIADDTNEMILSTDENKNVNEISYTLNSYGKYKKLVTNRLQITLRFSSFGEIQEISNPVG